MNDGNEEEEEAEEFVDNNTKKRHAFNTKLKLTLLNFLSID